MACGASARARSDRDQAGPPRVRADEGILHGLKQI